MCGPYGLGCWAQGWKHLRLLDTMPVGAHFCEGPVGEPRSRARGLT